MSKQIKSKEEKEFLKDLRKVARQIYLQDKGLPHDAIVDIIPFNEINRIVKKLLGKRNGKRSDSSWDLKTFIPEEIQIPSDITVELGDGECGRTTKRQLKFLLSLCVPHRIINRYAGSKRKASLLIENTLIGGNSYQNEKKKVS